MYVTVDIFMILSILERIYKHVKKAVQQQTLVCTCKLYIDTVLHTVISVYESLLLPCILMCKYTSCHTVAALSLTHE